MSFLSFFTGEKTSDPVVQSDIELSQSGTSNPLNIAALDEALIAANFDPASVAIDESVKSTEGLPNHASISSCFINLCNTIVGSGMLGLPYAFAKTGWLLGTIISVVCALFSSFALHTLALCALESPPPSSFYSVANEVLPSFTTLIDVAVAIKCFGVSTSYLIVMGDLMPEMTEQLGGNAFSQSRELWVLIGFAIVAPLSCLRSLDSLKFTSWMSIGFVFLLTVMVIVYSSDVKGLSACEGEGTNCAGPTDPVNTSMDTWRILSIFIFGFTCQQVG